MYIYVFIYNRESRFGAKLEVNTLRHGGTRLIFGGPNVVAVAACHLKLRGASWGSL